MFNFTFLVYISDNTHHSGDYVAAVEAYVVVETDKVSVDIRAQDGGGIVKKHMAGEGDTVEVGAPLVVLEHVEASAKSGHLLPL
jgi:pyruvate/2-oxoglutarate dehydrogenase complex dihydrolipoamide acyltransferase (E2) component